MHAAIFASHRAGGCPMVLGWWMSCVALLLSAASADSARGQERPGCAMAPAHLRIQIPVRGFAWLPGEEGTGRCEDLAGKQWRRRPSGRFDLLVNAQGPSGSGRYWEVAIAIAKRQEKNPRKGVCLSTSTVGWRTLGTFKNSPLPWIDDPDGDGKSELIIWEGFPLDRDQSAAGFGLTAWVYRPDSADSLSIDWDVSRKMAREIAMAYRTPMPGSSAADLRSQAAGALELFASGHCSVNGQQNRQP